MNSLLISLLNPKIKNLIDSVYQVQKKVYGIYVPPTLKQVLTLKELIIETGLRQEVNPDEFLGLSKIECKLLINELKKVSKKLQKNSSNSTKNVVVNL